MFAAVDAVDLTAAASIVAVAAIVRGFSGFGFSAFCVVGLSFFFAPAVATPLVLLLEIAASCALLPGARREIDRRFLLAASIGIAVGSPFGIWILAHAPPAAMRAGVCALVAVLALIILRPPQKIAVALAATPPLIVGLLAGIANGAAALAGLVAVVFLLSSRRDAAQIRATLIALFLFSDIWGDRLERRLRAFAKSAYPAFRRLRACFVCRRFRRRADFPARGRREILPRFCFVDFAGGGRRRACARAFALKG